MIEESPNRAWIQCNAVRLTGCTELIERVHVQLLASHFIENWATNCSNSPINKTRSVTLFNFKFFFFQILFTIVIHFQTFTRNSQYCGIHSFSALFLWSRTNAKLNWKWVMEWVWRNELVSDIVLSQNH